METTSPKHVTKRAEDLLAELDNIETREGAKRAVEKAMQQVGKDAFLAAHDAFAGLVEYSRELSQTIIE